MGHDGSKQWNTKKKEGYMVRNSDNEYKEK